MRWVAYLALWVGVIAGLVAAQGPTNRPLDANVDFEMVFDIDRDNGQVATGVQFRNFMVDLRHRAAEPDCLVGQLPILPRQQDDNIRFFDIVLRVTEGAVRLRFRRDNFYLIGHRIEGGNNAQWFECKPDPKKDKKGKPVIRAPWITGAQWLDFGENYQSLQHYAGHGRKDTVLGLHPMKKSVRDLAQSTKGQPQARAYLVLIQMLSEAARFTDLLAHIVDHWESEAAPEAGMIDRQNAWGPASELILQDPNVARNRLSAPLEQGGIRITGVTTLASLIQFMALLLQVDRGLNGGNGKLGRRSKAGQCKAPEAGWVPNGRPLLDILSVKTWYNLPRKYELYGKIWVGDSPDMMTKIYSLPVSESHAIAAGPGYEIPLNFNGVSRALSASNHISIGLELQTYDIPFGDKISTGTIEWDAFGNAGVNAYDSIQTERVDGDTTGYAEVEYIVMSNAAQAHIQLVMINGDDEDPAQVFGTVKAEYPMPRGAPRPSKAQGGDAHENDGKTITVTLLPGVEISPQQDVPKGGKIVLRKPFVVLPWDQELTLDLDLWDHNNLLSNKSIGKGKVIFAPEFEKSSKQIVKGEKGQIEVRVTWT
ncbi:hypothetical protein TWF696_004984 [Orbilia brochopaga]|uniref:rRNA N-glycosylase n=1 Tax=Orbilia brochopaga TaxID=3140254 RepID=A0AAV9V0A5_9PEZI